MAEQIRYRPCPRCKGSGKLIGRMGGLLRNRRELAGLSMREVARRLDISPTHLSDLENDRRGWDGRLVNRFNRAIKYRSATDD